MNTSTNSGDPRIVWFHMDGSVETPIMRRRKWYNERRQRKLYSARAKTKASSLMQRFTLPQTLLETPRVPRMYEPTAVMQRNETKLRRNLWLETDKDCEPQHEWQTTFHPTCNDMHELDLTDLTLTFAKTATTNNTSHPADASRLYVVATGGVRQAWSFNVNDFGVTAKTSSTRTQQPKQQRLALKMTRYNLELSEVNFISHQMDATISERLGASKKIVDIYNFCGNSALHEFAHDDLHSHIRMLGRRERLERQKSKRRRYKSSTALERLQLAIDTATALADFHSIDNGQEGRPSVAHTDLIDKQMISIVGDNGDVAWKLNDFNRARYIYQNKETRELCPYSTIGGFIGDLRAPEEFVKDRPSPQTAKVSDNGLVCFIPQ